MQLKDEVIDMLRHFTLRSLTSNKHLVEELPEKKASYKTILQLD